MLTTARSTTENGLAVASQSNAFCRLFSQSLVLSILFFLALLPTLATFPVGGSSEARELHVASAILRTGEWVLPLRNADVPSKPPLFHWISASISPTSNMITPFWGRLTSLFFAALMLLTTGTLAGHLALLSPKLKSKHLSISFLAIFILASTYGFLQVASDARVDMTFSFFVVATIAFGIFNIRLPNVSLEKSSLWLRTMCVLFAGLSAGLAVLAKGPLGIIIPLIVIGSCYVVAFGLRAGIVACLKIMLPVCLIAVAVSAPWYLAATQKGGSDFVVRQVLFENLSRFTGAEPTNAQPWWFFGPSFLRAAFPWSLIFIFLALKPGAVRRDATIFGLVWLCAGAIFFSLSTGKRHTYLLPLFPGVAIFIACKLVELYQTYGSVAHAKLEKTVRYASGALAFVALALLAASTFISHPLFFVRFPQFVDLKSWAGTGLLLLQGWMLLLVLLLLAGIRSTSTLRAASLKQISICSLGILSAIITFGLGVKYSLTGFEYNARRLAAALPTNVSGFVVKTREDEFLDPTLYYLGRDVQQISPDVKKLSPGYYITRAGWYSKNESKLQASPGFKLLSVYEPAIAKHRKAIDKSIAAFVLDSAVDLAQ